MVSYTSLSRFRQFMNAYETICKPYCQEIGLSMQAFEILIMIAKNQERATAQDICKEQNIKPTLMSFHIEKLVQSGYVERQAIAGNRRSIKLVVTEKAAPVIEKGKELYKKYTDLIWRGISEEEAKSLFSVLGKIYDNADKIINEDF